MESKDRLIYLIFTAQHKLRNYLIRMLQEAGLEVTPAHCAILFALLEGPRSMNELGRLLHIENSTVTGLIDRMEAKNFVRRTADPGDRRKWNITVNPAAMPEIDAARKVIRGVNDKIKDGFEDRDIEAMKKILDSFFDKFA